MFKIYVSFSMLLICLCLHTQTYSQGFLKKLKDKANQVVDKSIDKKIDEKTGTNQDNNNNSSGTNKTGKPRNTTGEALKNSTPPDVVQQISDAEKAHDAKNYSEARYAIQQALLGVEIQIGQQILKSLPVTVANLPKDTTEDRVMSSQWGWANLTIQRVYRQNDKQMTVVIGNNPLYSGMMDMYFNNAYATQSNGENQNMKQIKVKGYKAAIKFDASEGYSVLVQLGQSGMMTWQGINFSTEQDMLAAVNTFDIDGVKKQLGEK